MKIRFPIYAQIISFLVLNLILLRVLLALLFSNQFGLGWEPLLDSPVGERLDGIAWVIHRQTQTAPKDSWNNILKEFGKFYGVDFYIFDPDGHELVGEPISLPDTVVKKLASLNRHGRPSSNLDHLPPSNPNFLIAMRPPRLHGRFLLHTNNPDCFWMGTRFPMRDRSEGPTVLLAVSSNLWQSRLFIDFGLFLVALMGIFFLSVLIWWPFVHRLTYSLAQLTNATEKIADGKFDTALEVNQWDEIGRLAEAINATASRLNTFVTGQKRFLGDIAHELCSPISRLNIALELLETTGTPNQEGIIKDIKEEVAEMSSLINELLAFSKAGLRGKETELNAVNVEAVLKAAIAKTCPDNSVAVTVSPNQMALADEMMLERAFSNILRNAVRYASQDGPITVKSAQLSDELIVTFLDCGPGIATEALAFIGQPFYRPEQSRNRDFGGVGLGLAIVKTCVEACDGTFSVRNRQPKGLEVEVRLKAYSTVT